jgi:hypothetical protein
VKQYVELDVSQKKTALCVVDEKLAEASAALEAPALRSPKAWRNATIRSRMATQGYSYDTIFGPYLPGQDRSWWS